MRKKKLIGLVAVLVAVQAVTGLIALSLKRRYESQLVGPGEVNAVAVTSGKQLTITETDFKGGYIRAVMGGLEIDCREARIESPPARIEVTVVMGGVEMKVPPDWAVELEARTALGGLQDRRPPFEPKTGRPPDLVISGLVALGGLEIA